MGTVLHQAAMGLRALAALTPDRALVLLTMGVLLIYIELNRPGWIVAGALGLLASLFAAASLLRVDLNAAAVALVGTAAGLLLLDLLRRTPPIVAASATLALALGFDHLVHAGARPGNVPVHTAVAVGCGTVIGAGTSILTRVARRARTNKGLDYR